MRKRDGAFQHNSHRDPLSLVAGIAILSLITVIVIRFPTMAAPALLGLIAGIYPWRRYGVLARGLWRAIRYLRLKAKRVTNRMLAITRAAEFAYLSTLLLLAAGMAAMLIHRELGAAVVESAAYLVLLAGVLDWSVLGYRVVRTAWSKTIGKLVIATGGLFIPIFAHAQASHLTSDLIQNDATYAPNFTKLATLVLTGWICLEVVLAIAVLLFGVVLLTSLIAYALQSQLERIRLDLKATSSPISSSTLRPTRNRSLPWLLRVFAGFALIGALVIVPADLLRAHEPVLERLSKGLIVYLDFSSHLPCPGFENSTRFVRTDRGVITARADTGDWSFATEECQLESAEKEPSVSRGKGD